MEFEVVDNSRVMAGRRAGLPTAQMIIDKGVDVVITGNCGPNAMQILSSAGVKVITDVSGSIQDVLSSYKIGNELNNPQTKITGYLEMGNG